MHALPTLLCRWPPSPSFALSLIHMFVALICFGHSYILWSLLYTFWRSHLFQLSFMLIVYLTGSYRDSKTHGMTSLGPSKPLEQRVARLEDLLVQRVRARLVAIFSSCVTTASSSTTTTASSTGTGAGTAAVVAGEENASSSSSSETKESSPPSSSEPVPTSSEAFPSRAFAHCLRALVALSRGEVGGGHWS